MNLAQENFDSAVKSAKRTLGDLLMHKSKPIELGSCSKHYLQSLAWDLEAIQAAIRIELNNRSERPVDLG